MISALRPMRARRPDARFAMLSTAWLRSDPFWTAWASEDPSWMRLKATADTDPTLFAAGVLERERRALSDHDFKREFLGIPGGGQASPFTWDLYDHATRFHVPKVPPGPAFAPPHEPPAIALKNPFKDLHTLGGLR
jgi:hypothetical protein